MGEVLPSSVMTTRALNGTIFSERTAKQININKERRRTIKEEQTS